MVVMGEYDGREVLVIVIVILLLYNRTIRGEIWCSTVHLHSYKKRYFFGRILFTNKQQDVLFVFLIVFVCP